MDYLAVDLETTGLSPKKDKIIEIGAVKYHDGVRGEEFSCLVRIWQPLPERVQELTGITPEMLEEQGIPEEEAIREFLEFAKDMPVLLGHNILFDFSFLKQAASCYGSEFERTGLDTLKFARALLPELESRRLPDLCEHYEIEPRHSHRALEDAVMAACLFERLREQFPEYQGFCAQELNYRVAKYRPASAKQKKRLAELLKHHGLDEIPEMEQLSQSEVSRRIDQIILTHGR